MAPMGPLSNLAFFQETKKKISSQNRQDIKVIWKHNTPNVKILTWRYVKYPGRNICILQIGANVKCQQGVTIKKKGEVVKEVPMTTVSELVVVEANFNVGPEDPIQWKLLDILDNDGVGILPRQNNQTYLEES